MLFKNIYIYSLNHNSKTIKAYLKQNHLGDGTRYIGNVIA